MSHNLDVIAYFIHTKRVEKMIFVVFNARLLRWVFKWILSL